MDHETAGDPLSGLKWTRRTTAKVAAELGKLGTDICARTVARVLKKMGFSLRVNHKKRAGASHRAHSRFPGHALTPTGVMAIRCKQFHLPDL